MRSSSAGRWFAAILLVCAASPRLATGDEPATLADDLLELPELIIRGQSLPPPQLRIASGTPIQADPYYAAPAVTTMPALPPLTAQPSGVVCLPAMDPYAQCAPVQTTCPWQGHMFGVFAEFLYLESKETSVSYAVPQNGLLLPGATPVGPVSTTQVGFSPGWRAGAFVAFGPEARLGASYTWFTSHVDSSVNTGGADVINPLVMFPGTFNAGFTAQQASAYLAVNYQLIDIDYEVIGACCEHYWFGYLLGARYGKLEQGLNVTYPFAPPDGTTTVSSSTTFEGVGPRAGVEGERILFPSLGFRAYGKTTASFLVGNFRNSYTQVNQFGGTEVNTSLTEDRISPLLDAELGLAWVGPAGHVRISGGYMVAAWFNAVSTNEWIASVQNVTFQPGSSTITFDGLVARAEVRF